MQCILTKIDQETFYGSFSSEQASFTCPYCSKFGLSESTLGEHITAQHGNSTKLPEVVCPICAVIPSSSGGDPNHLTDNLLSHLNNEHLNKIDELASTGSGSNQSAAALRYSRRLNYAQNASRTSLNTTSSNRTNLSNNRYTFQFGTGSGSNPLSSFMRSASSGLESLGSSATSPMDPIAELLSQLTGVRRAAATAHSTNLQLQQLQAQLSRERENLQQQSAAAAVLAATNPSSTTTASTRHHFHHHLFAGSGKSQLINSLTKNLTGTGASTSSTQQSNANNAAQATQTANNMTTAFTNQILELHSNALLKPLPENSRDPRFLLSKYVTK